MAVRKKAIKQLKDDQARGAQRDLLEQLFDDHYKNKWLVYKINFFRGLFFGFGSVLGATVLVGILLGILSIFTDLPVIGDFFQKTQTTIKEKRN